jgi:uncharacterized membrane protein YjfL (UPF0719 family)
MEAVKGYGMTLVWFGLFLVLAYVARILFDKLSPFELDSMSRAKNRAVGHVLRGLYVGLAVVLMAAIGGNRSLPAALLDGGIGVFLMLLTYVVFDRIDPRDFGTELAADNTMLGMEIEGVFILTAALVVGAMNLALF